MPAPNFRSMLYGMPMVCGGMEDFDDLKTAFEEDYGEEYTMAQYQLDMEDEYENAVSLAKAFSENLVYHYVTVESGYYSGFQFFVEEKYSAIFDLDRNSKYCIDKESARYYFGLCRSSALREANAEKRKITRWLENLAGNSGYEVLVCTARFSNGEAFYERRTPRTSLLAAARA